jgi:fluoroquinolone resistance protein
MSIEDSNEYFSQTFKSLDLSNSAFSDIVFENCTFQNCNFSDAQFHQCKFLECSFSNSNLSNLAVKYTRFIDVNFDECKLIGINWTTADWPRLNLSSPLRFTQCIMNDSSFFGLSLAELSLAHCKAHDVDFRNGNFAKSIFTHTDFTNSLFSKTNLKETDFSEAQNYTIDVFNNDIRGARFSRYEALSLLDSLAIELVD